MHDVAKIKHDSEVHRHIETSKALWEDPVPQNCRSLTCTTWTRNREMCDWVKVALEWGSLGHANGGEGDGHWVCEGDTGLDMSDGGMVSWLGLTFLV